MEKQDLKLVETVEATLTEMVTGNVVKEIITKQLESTVTDIVSNSMRSYSKFGKAIEDKINNVIEIAASNIELPEYNKFISEMVVKQFDKVLGEQAKTQIQELINNELGCIEKGIITCKQLQAQLVEHFENQDHDDCKEIEVQFSESEYGAIYIHIKDEEEIKLTLYNHGHRKSENGYYIGYMETGFNWSKRSTNNPLPLSTYCMSKLERYLYRLYCSETRIDITDSHNLESFTVGDYY